MFHVDCVLVDGLTLYCVGKFARPLHDRSRLMVSMTLSSYTGSKPFTAVSDSPGPYRMVDKQKPKQTPGACRVTLLLVATHDVELDAIHGVELIAVDDEQRRPR